MKFRQFLNEGRTQTISREIYDSKIKNYMSNIEIYRHINYFDDEYGIVDPSKFERESAYASHNYYTLLFDNLPSWKGWPKRSKSIVCTTSSDQAFNRASFSGAAYEVHPKKGSKIAVCPAEDIWFSFIDVERNIGNLNDLNRLLYYNLFEENDISTYNEMLDYDITIDELKDNMHEEDYFSEGFNILFFDIKKNEKIITGYLNRILDPDKNGFKLISSGHNLPDTVEVWIEGECLVKKMNDDDY